MNKHERCMASILEESRSQHGILALKGEFEAEGARLEEMQRLKDIASSAGLSLTVKIGGCEAIRDMRDAKTIGVGYLIAPMAETPYSVLKYSQAVAANFLEEERDSTDFLFNVETATSLENLNSSVLAAKEGRLNGIVFGRVDFSGSLGWTREKIDSDEVLSAALAASKIAQDNDLDFVVGGGISDSSRNFLSRLQGSHLSRFETRKIVFSGDMDLKTRFDEALEVALRFEILWLENKRNLNMKIAEEDVRRIKMLQERLGQAKSNSLA